MELSKTKSESLFFEHASFVVARERERERERERVLLPARKI